MHFDIFLAEVLPIK